MLDPTQIQNAVKRYIRERDRYRKLAENVSEKCKDIIDENAIRAYVQWRAKEPDSLRKKLSNEEKSGDYEDVDEVFDEMPDLAGVRVVTYTERAREDVVEQIEKTFSGPGNESDVDVDVKNKHENDTSNFYRATHCQVSLKEDDLVGRKQNLQDDSCEIQVCSLLAHVWNEIEHDLGYKKTTGELSETEKDLLKALGNLAMSGDDIINTLLRANSERIRKRNDEFVDVHDFVYRMRDEFFENANNFAENSKQLFEELQGRGLTSPEDIESKLLENDQYNQKARALIDELNDFIEANNDKDIVELNPETSDLLLVLYLDKHLADTREDRSLGRGKGGPRRLDSIALRLEEMLEEKESSNTETAEQQPV